MPDAPVWFPPRPPAIMAVINASPESFFAGSVAAGGEAVARAAAEAEAAGAAMIDIGAMSTAPRPGTRIDTTEECRRMAAAVRAARRATTLPISADTQRAAVARAALDEGADLINDVSGLRDDPALAAVAARARGVVLMASEDPAAPPLDADPVTATLGVLRAAIDRATAAGIPRARLVVDPGLGFFRHQSIPWHEWDMALLAGLDAFHALGLPVLVGASRKSFLGQVLGRPDPADRLAGSLAVAAWAARHGGHWLRVHDVAATRDVLHLWSELEGRRQ